LAFGNQEEQKVDKNQDQDKDQIDDRNQNSDSKKIVRPD
jgi:hypothetical protein